MKRWTDYAIWLAVFSVCGLLVCALVKTAHAANVCPEQADIYELALADTQGTLQEAATAKIKSGACADLPSADYFRTLSVYKDKEGVESRVVVVLVWGKEAYALGTTLPSFLYEVTWRDEYSKLPPEVLQWYKNATLTPEAEKRFGWHNCCDHADVVKAQFKTNARKDEWFYSMDEGVTWKQVPPDIIHWGVTAPYGLPTLFVFAGKETCFYPPEGGV